MKSLKCQQSTYLTLQDFAKGDKHSVIIEGPKQCGKTFMAREYAKLLGIQDFQLVKPTVSELREVIDSCSQIENNIVLCIENLDQGVVAASYTMLKFLEEPRKNTYIVITCSSCYRLPDTIISRSHVATINPPTSNDISDVAHSLNIDINSTPSELRNCCKNFADIQIVSKLDTAKRDYLNFLCSRETWKDSISNIVWKLGHWSDNTEAPVEFIINYLMKNMKSTVVYQAGCKCLQDLDDQIIGTHLTLCKFAYECKYIC